MTRYGLVILTVLLFVSCSSHRKNCPSHLAAAAQTFSHNTEGIKEALSFSDKEMTEKTGVYTLENGGQSLFSRLWFIEHAQKSIDIQYYSFAKDITGLIATDYIVRAADKGIKIRLLIDDAASRMYSHEVQLLDSHENIEIRVYNAGLMLGRLDRRVKKLIENSNRLLRRMHNKTFTIDAQVCITGGRNIADQYFDFDHRYNFRDRDVILIGRALNEVNKSFEKFWKDTLTIQYAKLSKKGDKKKYKNSNRFDRLHCSASRYLTQELKEKVNAFPEEIKAAQQAGELLWVENVLFISDNPGKNEDRKNRKGGICSDSLICLIQLAKTSIDIQSPYFITTEESKKIIREAIQRGVKIRLLTNSLSSTDNHEAFSGYQKDRKEILETGIQVYEFKPDAKVRFKRMIPEVQAPLNYKPVYGLHSKTIIIDKSITVIGSYNFDPRSANYNTECIAVIRSPDVAKNVIKYIEEEFLPENSWQTTLDYNPDSEAGIKKRIKVASRRIIPKKLL